MPSGQHEAPIELATLAPNVVVDLLSDIFLVKMPGFHEVTEPSTDMRMLAPRTYHADGALLFKDAYNQPMLGVVLEVQRGWDPRKQWTWMLYVAHMAVRLRVRTLLLVYCPDPTVARRYERLYEPRDRYSPQEPPIFSPRDVPRVVNVEQARANPALAVFSAICHGNDVDIDDYFPALAEVLRTAGPEAAASYEDILVAGLPRAVRIRWEVYMAGTVGPRFCSDFYRQLDARLRAEGLAKGEGRSLLTVLETRRVAVPAAAREQILSCTDLDQLDAWLRRAVTATTIDEVLQAQPERGRERVRASAP
ncbi:hypothetical protein I6A84_06835 [Frankia sp. CNm7]|uniref:Transposase (putative) YhgA-like domain-containing protein n=2 Tax=Frankia nepalensis TaxID=1836974 RepID=A0A937RMK5_9ACTN|nr:hypothetical protein [Frankia nepalensis]MBL7511152.1 hypothetical protein [Frankia nepalensis]MBL7517847.1 hypothetical protein [Frankia nepalensis]MBL7631564.1 hypothetical protein [Frankia nepalensis]